MQWLAALSIKRPVFASVLILALTVIGAFSFSRLGLDRFPKVDFPTVLVTTRLPGAAPEEVETEISDKIEEAVNTISGIDELRSTSSEGVSIIFVSFLLEKDGDVAAQEVRDKINGVRQVVVLGGRQRQINVWLDADRLRAYNLTVTDVSHALQGQNIEVPGGRVDQGAQSVTLRTRGRVQSI